MRIDEFIFSANNLETVHKELETLGIYPKQHSRYSNLYQYTYDQIDSAKNKFHPLVVSSRGIILDIEKKKIVAYPFNRFFNYGEKPDQTFDFASMRVQEKLDGSLVIAYFYDGDWQFATKGSPDAQGNVGAYSFTFNELIRKTIITQYPDYRDRMNPDLTYMFELTSKYNQIVTNQENNEGCLTLIGVRDLQTLEELPVVNFADKFLVVQEFDLKDIEQVLAVSKMLKPSECEGYVLVDKNFQRIKVKSPLYVAAHHMLGELSSKDDVVRLIREGELDEIASYLPHKAEDLKQQEAIYFNTIKKMQEYWETPVLQQMIQEGKSRKELALWIMQNIPQKYTFAIFSLLDKKYPDMTALVNALPVERAARLVFED